MKSLLTTLFAVCLFMIATGQQTSHAIKMQEAARQHMQQEQNEFKPEDIQKAEELHREASNIQREHGDARQPLGKLVATYPQLNRAGCAQLYLAQSETGQEKERLLKDCIKRFSNCYYGDRAPVGPLAMLQLAAYYRQAGKEQDAKKLVDKLCKEHPEAVVHNGLLLLDEM